MIGPANEVLPPMSRATLVTLARLQPNGFQTAIGVSYSRFSWPRAMASTA